MADGTTSMALVVDSAAMSTLNDILLAPGNRPKVVVDCVRLIDEEVDSKGGSPGWPSKAPTRWSRREARLRLRGRRHMIDDFVEAPGSVLRRRSGEERADRPALNARAGEVAEALLAISDERAQRAKNNGLKKAYERLRPTGKKHVEAAVPRIGRLVAKYATAPATSAAPPAP